LIFTLQWADLRIAEEPQDRNIGEGALDLGGVNSDLLVQRPTPGQAIEVKPEPITTPGRVGADTIQCLFEVSLGRVALA